MKINTSVHCVAVIPAATLVHQVSYATEPLGALLVAAKVVIIMYHGFPCVKWHLSEQRHSSLVLPQTPKPSVSSYKNFSHSPQYITLFPITFAIFISSTLVQVAIPVKQAVRVEIWVKMLALAAVYCFHFICHQNKNNIQKNVQILKQKK